jgi:hypothetical protein
MTDIIWYAPPLTNMHKRWTFNRDEKGHNQTAEYDISVPKSEQARSTVAFGSHGILVQGDKKA